MHTTLERDQNQTIISQRLAVSDKFGMFDYYFSRLKLGTMLNRSGITKTKGASPLELFTIVFNLAFIGQNFFEGIVRNKKIQVGKDAVYNFLNSSTYNWRRFLLLVSNQIYIIISHFLDDSSEEVLIFDDSTYDRSRSKTVELLSRVFDHTTGRYLKGFRMPTLGWSDGNKAKIIFVSCDKKRGWLVLFSTDITIADEEMIRLYGKRWDIEVFFKMCKQHLKLVKEIQIRNYDGLIGHTSLVMIRYNIISLFQRESIDDRSFGDIFRVCYEELANITFIDALKRILELAMAVLRKTHNLSKKIIDSMLDVIMGEAIAYFGLNNNRMPQQTGISR